MSANAEEIHRHIQAITNLKKAIWFYQLSTDFNIILKMKMREKQNWKEKLMLVRKYYTVGNPNWLSSKYTMHAKLPIFMSPQWCPIHLTAFPTPEV